MQISRKKILIIALAQSTHTYAWLNLIDQKKFDVRLFGVLNTCPNININQFYYSFSESFPFVSLKAKKNQWLKLIRKIIYLLDAKFHHYLEKWWLKLIINSWSPDIIHTLGVEPASEIFLDLTQSIKSQNFCWVTTIRGGSDIELNRFDEDKSLILKNIFTKSDYVLADNPVTYKHAFNLGLSKIQMPPWPFVPGTGGVDVEKLSKMRHGKTSASRMILWPKACDAIYSKGLPVLEALRVAWPKIKPCQIIMTVVDDCVKTWSKTLPIDMQESIEFFDRVSREQLLKIMSRSRVILLPSLVDGVANAIYEAMATMAFPIVSPLETIKSVIPEKNVLFARNLYPGEIAQALIKVMDDHKLVDKITKDNLLLVKRVADRKKIKPKVNKFYDSISKNV